MNLDYFFIKADGKHIRIGYDEILYIEAASSYTKLHTTRKTHLTYVTIDQWNHELPDDMFCKVHRSFIVSLMHIFEFDKKCVQVGTTKIPLCAPLKKHLMEKIKVIERRDAIWRVIKSSLNVDQNSNSDMLVRV